MADVESLWGELDDLLIPLFQRYRRNLRTLRVDTKPDHTLLSEADPAVQTAIAESVLRHYPGSRFVAEEDDASLPTTGDPIWIIDPIDGTSEFVAGGRHEFCSVVCLLEGGTPIAAYVLAPELGPDRTPISIHWSAGAVTVDGRPATPLSAVDRPNRASVTRSGHLPPRPFEAELAAIGCDMKLRTTSQTLDMVRTCIDLTPWTNAPQHQFDLFYRRDQKLWDGAAGIGLAAAMGRSASNGSGASPYPFGDELLNEAEPILTETISGDPRCVRWFVDLLGEARNR
ncbi:inositol monophosphatase family protein [Nocardia sp. NPDC052254]|uniref:inositol monophosphatase family protein n=1 Tax=Nocardia sp. NPDC052254 TaxID=3155681 RepID=UPI0034360AA8